MLIRFFVLSCVLLAALEKSFGETTAATTLTPKAAIPKPYSFTRMQDGITVTTLKYFTRNGCFKGMKNGKQVMVCKMNEDGASDASLAPDSPEERRLEQSFMEQSALEL